MNNIRHILWAAVAISVAAPASAQSETEQTSETGATQTIPCQGDAYRAFDFWIGEWEVHIPDGRLAGVNSIQPINGGCGLIERYSVNGQPYGQSYNFYDPVRAQWTQLWLSPGLIIRLEGPVGDGEAMTMHGTSTYEGQPVARAFSGRWTLQTDGTVKQEFWEQDPETGQWSSWFTGIYSQTSEATDP